jgi:hypothetical protein
MSSAFRRKEKMLKRNSLLVVAAAVAMGAGPLFANADPAPTHQITGTIVSVRGNTMLLQKRDGTKLTVDLSAARANSRVGVLAPHLAVEVYGAYRADGVFACTAAGHAPPVPRSWEADR